VPSLRARLIAEALIAEALIAEAARAGTTDGGDDCVPRGMFTQFETALSLPGKPLHPNGWIQRAGFVRCEPARWGDQGCAPVDAVSV